MKKFKSLFLGLGCLALLGGCFSSAFALYTGDLPTNKEFTISLDLPEPTGFYLKTFRMVEAVEQEYTSSLIVNPSNDSELMVSNVSLVKGDKIKVCDSSNWYGTSSSYQHNITLPCSVVVNAGGDYYAVQTGSYDIYVEFTDNTYTSYVKTYVRVNETKVVYLQDTWDKGEVNAPKIHYWGDDIYEFGDFSIGRKMTTQEGNHDMYEAVVPATATGFCVRYDGNYSLDASFDDTNNAYWAEWDSGISRMRMNGYVWANPE